MKEQECPQPNEVAQWVAPGMEKWRSIAHTHFLGNLRVPQIITPPRQTSVVVMTGHHLEETSGPKFALEPDHFKPFMNAFDFMIFPVINQHGLNFPANANENLLRKNTWGINYNSGWGKPLKTAEGRLIEQEILHRKFDVAISLHEDSTTPGEGSFYTNGLNPHQLDKFVDVIFSNHGFRLAPKAITIDEQDGHSSEYWLSKQGIQTFLIEAPFGLPMEERIAFIQYFFYAILALVGKIRW